MAEFRSNYEINKMINSGEPFPSYGFKNYIINGGFDVWQRGTTFSSPINGYTADRWRVSSNITTGVTVNKVSTAYGNQIEIVNTNTSGQTYFTLQQRLELDTYKKLNNKTITISFQVRSNTDVSNQTISVFFQGDITTKIGDFNIVGINEWNEIEVTATLPNDTSISSSYCTPYIQLPLNVACTVKIANVQLEEGSVATPFERTDPAIELLRCQRYLPYRAENDGNYKQIGKGWALNTTLCRINIPLQTKARITDGALSTSGAFQLVDGYSVSQDATSILVDTLHTTKYLLVLDVSVASGLTAGKSFYLRKKNDINAYIQYDCEIY